ncbi:hypothetical protein [Microbulbifer sp. ANSA005]|uniref:hypothetical protein n=1 Tax=Microbulbifer sp. ANSA005 TaxID=3243362 RepID=UPI004042C968
MRILVLLITFIPAAVFAGGTNCTSDGDSDHYKNQLKKFNAQLLCGLSPEYVAGFRIVFAPSFGQAKITTVYQRHDGTLDVNGKYPLSLSQYMDMVSQFKDLNLFELESYDRLIDLYCAKPPKLSTKIDSSEPNKCPLGFDGETVYIEAAYGGQKRTVQRWNGLSVAPDVERDFSKTANFLLNILDSEIKE